MSFFARPGRRWRPGATHFLLALILAAPMALVSLQAQNRYGLIIGSNYKQNISGIPPLDLCERDAELMEQSLRSQGRFTDVKVLLGRMVTAQNIEAAINELATKVSSNDTVAIYFSGHGTYERDPNAQNGVRNYVVMYERPHVPDNVLNTWVKKIHTDKLVWIFDCCFSGGLANRGQRARGTGQVPIDPGEQGRVLVNAREDIFFDDKAIVASSDADETSIEVRGSINHGIFTYFFAQALTPANGDMNRDGTVTILEAFEWARPRVTNEAKRFNHNQNPQISGRASGIFIAGNITPTPPQPTPQPTPPQPPEPPQPGPTPPDMPDPVTPDEPQPAPGNVTGNAVIYTTILRSIAAGPTPMDPMTLIMRNRRGNSDRNIAVKFSGQPVQTRITWLTEAQLRQRTGEQIPLGFYSYQGRRINNQVAMLEVTGAPTGVHEVEIQADGYPIINERLGVERNAANNKIFVVASLSGYGTIRGKVFLRSFDSPLAGQDIWMPVVNTTNQQHRMRSMQDGSFWFLNLPPNSNYFIKASFLESTALDDRTITVEDGQTTNLDIVLTQRMNLNPPR
ncbi:MAG: caspase family protein [Leptospirales bacterium]|nr:caspase family protein [Leptospirales bacterium]